MVLPPPDKVLQLVERMGMVLPPLDKVLQLEERMGMALPLVAEQMGNNFGRVGSFDAEALNGCLPVKQGSDWCEIAPTRFSDNLQRSCSHTYLRHWQILRDSEIDHEK